MERLELVTTLAVKKKELHTPGIFSQILRGVRMRCPRCAMDGVYERWNVFKHQCAVCGYGFEEREGNCWFFLYSTTAALTGLFLIAMLLWRPADPALGRIVLTVAAIVVIPASLPLRKGIALALEYYSEIRGSHLLLYEEEDQDEERKVE